MVGGLIVSRLQANHEGMNCSYRKLNDPRLYDWYGYNGCTIAFSAITSSKLVSGSFKIPVDDTKNAT